MELSVGAVEAICQRASAALQGPHGALVGKVLSSPVLNIDETGWFTAHERRTLWTAATQEAAIFRIAEDRHRDRLAELIGKDFGGIVSSDRWWAYELIDVASRQACWEHLERDFAFHAGGVIAEQKRFGEAGLELTRRLFELWHAFESHEDRERLIAEMAPLQVQLRELLRRAARKSAYTRFHRRFAKNLLKIWPALWTFLTVEGVQPTNNAAERARCAGRSSTESSRTAPNRRRASASLSAHCRPRSPAGCRTARCSAIYASYSAPAPAVIRCRRSSESTASRTRRERSPREVAGN